MSWKVLWQNMSISDNAAAIQQTQKTWGKEEDCLSYRMTEPITEQCTPAIRLDGHQQCIAIQSFCYSRDCRDLCSWLWTGCGHKYVNAMYVHAASANVFLQSSVNGMNASVDPVNIVPTQQTKALLVTLCYLLFRILERLTTSRCQVVEPRKLTNSEENARVFKLEESARLMICTVCAVYTSWPGVWQSQHCTNSS